MPDLVIDLATKGAALKPDDRSRLIGLLLVSLHVGPLAEVDDAWDEEVERRLSAHDHGELPSIDGDEELS